MDRPFSRAYCHFARCCSSSSCNWRASLSGSFTAGSVLLSALEIIERVGVEPEVPIQSANNVPGRRKLIAYVAPMALFFALLALEGVLEKLGTAFWLQSAEYWIYPLQAVVCAVLLIWFRREYNFNGVRRPLIAVGVAIGVFVVWISPQLLFHAAPRLSGFNPDVFSSQPAAYWATVVFRFLRLVVVVPFVEEIFWRGFLLRYFIDEAFDRVAFGAFSWLSFLVVTIGFTLAHSSADWPAAFVTGALYNLVAYRTKSLGSCVLAHAITNLLLGVWIMKTGQWGFW